MRNMNIQIRWNRFGSLILCVVLLFAFLSPTSVFASESESKVVRIGWYQSYLFQDGMSDEEQKSGYSYEYIHHIADYNGWIYEYVYGEWSDLFAMLKNGEIDVLAGVSKTEERMEYLLYPDEIMGNENYVLYQHSSNRSMDAADIDTFQGKKIGAITDNLMTTCLENWLSENGAEAEIIYYEGFEERDQDFAEGKIDAIVATDNNILLSDGYTQIVRVGKEAYYLAVTKGRDDLLKDLNRAQSYIQDIDPYYLTNLEYQSYGTTLANSTLTFMEESWVSSHSVLTIGYLENYIPYCGTDADGNAYGLITDVMDAIIKELNLGDRIHVAYQGFADGNSMNEALKNGSIDAAFPVGRETWQLEQKGIKATNELVTTDVNLVYKGSFTIDTIQKIAVTAGNTLMEDYIAAELPNINVTEYESVNACLDAVLNGKEDATIINGLRVDIIKKNRDYNSLSLMRMSKTSRRCLGVASDNTGLQMLLNRGIKLIGTDFASNAAYNYMSDLYDVTVLDFVENHLELVGGVIGVVIVIIILAAALLQNKTKAFLKIEEEKNEELREKQFLLEEAATEQAAQIEEISALNSELEERQAQLEESSAEQEAQIEEITALNGELQELKVIADEANRAKTVFLNNMSHDIRTPMNAILGFTELMEKKKDDPEQISDYINKIKTSGEYLLNIINNILDMSRIESGMMTIDESVMDLLGEESKVFASIIEMARKKNQTFSMFNTIKHRYVLCDVSKQQEIMMNLLSNAIKYTPEGGSIIMNMDELPCKKAGYGTYRLTVSDNGIGMSKEFQAELFESFTREKNTTESKVIGTGLGMAIVKKLVDLLEGSITVESEQGKGTTFTVTFDHKIMDGPDDSVENIDPVSRSKEILSGKRILLAEDNDLNAEIGIAVLEENGLIVERVSDGVECVDNLMRAEPRYYDLILMDIQMPNLNGYEATKRIRVLSDPEKANIPIVAMTANAFDEDKENARKAGMNGHLAKPIEIPKLIKMLTSIFSKEIDTNG